MRRVEITDCYGGKKEAHLLEIHTVPFDGHIETLCIVASKKGNLERASFSDTRLLDLPTPDQPQEKPLSDSDRAHMEELRVRALVAEARLAWIASKVTAIRDDITSMSIGFQNARGVDWVTGKDFNTAVQKAMRETGDLP